MKLRKKMENNISSINECRICKENSLSLMEIFRPFIDKEWSFDIFQCMNCGVRYAIRDSKID